MFVANCSHCLQRVNREAVGNSHQACIARLGKAEPRLHIHKLEVYSSPQLRGAYLEVITRYPVQRCSLISDRPISQQFRILRQVYVAYKKAVRGERTAD